MTSAVQMRLVSKTKTEMEEVCHELGMSMNTAFVIYAKIVAFERPSHLRLRQAPSIQERIWRTCARQRQPLMLATYEVEIAFFREAYTSESSGRIKKTVSFVINKK